MIFTALLLPCVILNENRITKKIGSTRNEASIPLSFHVDMYHISVIHKSVCLL